jgi:predicted MFS family arabinose efflux permease
MTTDGRGPPATTVDDLDAALPWWRIAVGSGAAMFLCMALGRFSYSAMIPALVEAGRLDAVAAGYVGGANMVGFLTGAALSTALARHLRLHRLLFTCLLIAVAGLWASALPWGPLWLGGWRAAIGFATGLVMVLGLAAAAQTAPMEKRTLAMTTIFVGVGTGILFGATAVPALLSVGLEAAWTGIAAAGILAALVARWGWSSLARITATPAPGLQPAALPRGFTWMALVAASFLFSFGIVPHTIYWFDYLARDLGHGYWFASLHWTGVGLFGIIGPLLAAGLAGLAGTAAAIGVVYLVMTVGIALPWATTAPLALAVSTMIFGAQPAVSALLGARARDLGNPTDMQRMMRAIILSNAIGSAAGGMTVPLLLDRTGSYETLFLAGGIAFALATVLLAPAALAARQDAPRMAR